MAARRSADPAKTRAAVSAPRRRPSYTRTTRPSQAMRATADRAVTLFLRFVRDPMDMASDSEPGMGVAFEGLERDSRELILRLGNILRRTAPSRSHKQAG